MALLPVVMIVMDRLGWMVSMLVGFMMALLVATTTGGTGRVRITGRVSTVVILEQILCIVDVLVGHTSVNHVM